MNINNVQIIDGYHGGIPTIEAAMIRDHNISLYGDGDYVLNVGNKFAHEIVNNNNITIKDGMAVIGGARCILGYGKTINAVIENGTSGYKRNDLIVLEYSLDNGTLVETVSLKVVKGELDTVGTDPQLVRGNIRAGSTLHQMPLKRVKIDGLSISAVEDLWTAAVFPIAVGGTGAVTAADSLNNLLENKPLPIDKGGTGVTTAAEVRNALGLGNTTGALPIANGGTGATTISNFKLNFEIGKLLWSGSWGSGNINVPAINNYTVVAAKLSGEAVILIGVKPFGTLRMYGIYFNSSSGNSIDYEINISISGGVLTLNSAGYKSGSSAHVGKPVSEIWGII